MKNSIICKQCHTENPFYQHICLNCKNYLRERVVNLDLWKVIGQLIETPVKAFSQLIYSEHKNFIVLIIILAAVKLLLDSVFIAVALKANYALDHFFLNVFLMLIGISLYLYLFSLVLNSVNEKLKLITRVNDNFAIYIFSFIPHIFALLFLFPIELVVFGNFLFSYDPSPFELKNTLAYTLLVIEFLIIVWGMFLNFMAAYTQSRSIKYSLFVTLLFNLFLYFGIFLFANLLL